MLNKIEVCLGRVLKSLVAVELHYGSTRSQVKRYQKSKGLKADGIAGKQTITSLCGIWGG